ncbi:hypothetical protein [Agarilytica rhodophyticola]|uniref:hypothetical protein n=1 Tax=Agarilytica rhodophyticola TaxID=1737490 RepID=UPI000B345457|nr:hypothetical protein [Agarilytica rhodophyticola]
MSLTDILMILGFALAAYSIIANDSIQTLGTFIASNTHRPWWVLWAFAAFVLVSVVGVGWYLNGGDPAYGRLEKFPWPENGIQWFHVLPPLVILVLTRFGVPVSTTFLVLVVFNPSNLGSMLIKSVSGYVVAFIVAIITYRLVISKTTEYFDRTKGEPAASYWVWLQWIATAFLWSQWLIQDLANIFVYLPRQISAVELLFAVFFIVILQGVIFYQMGGAIQKIVTNKTGTSDIRAATIIDFIYAIILLVFKEWSNMPMSTTWVFIGLLAGRQIAITLHLYKPPMVESKKIVFNDVIKAGLGLLISVVLAILIPVLS